ncbi:MAG: radical SAM protein [Hyperthermus sp.]|nr:MAG: radical SAM protein [Hyperthermus sp.]
MGLSRVLILDGYTDEPAGFGVPPYIDVYPRYIAGALWLVDPGIVVHYVTVDEARRDLEGFLERANSYDLVVFIAGAIVPGKYIGGEPIRLEELKSWPAMLERPFKVLVGPAARWGIGNEGGSIAVLPREVKSSFDAVVTGDVEAYFYEAARHGVEHAEEWRVLDDLELTGKAAVKGARIVRQHPNHGYNLIAEIETYRGCARWITGGCSFCATRLYGRPRQRTPLSVVREVEALYLEGVRHFRIGRQADIIVYGSRELGEEEWPKPEPEMLRRLFHGLRMVAPGLETLHIDNVNPGTLVRHREESVEALKTIIKYHTPGDVAALGIETADPRVVKINNLKTMPDESLEAVRLVNRVGNKPSPLGLPELLPGINFVLGLPGETSETYRLNLEFLERIYEEGLLVRRINVRKVLVLPGTRLVKEKVLERLRRHERLAKIFRREVMRYSRMFLERLLPRGSILCCVYVEKYSESLGVTFARQAGSYPVVVELPCKLPRRMLKRVFIYDVSARSVRGLPLPLNANTTPLTLLSRVLGRTLALRIAGSRPLKTEEELQKILGEKGGESLVSLNGFSCK